jgi:hypothetical protein
LKQHFYPDNSPSYCHFSRATPAQGRIAQLLDAGASLEKYSSWRCKLDGMANPHRKINAKANPYDDSGGITDARIYTG